MSSPVRCPDCGQICVSEHGLNIHRGQTHEKQDGATEPATCPECEREFANERAVKIHQTAIHGGGA